MTNAKFMREFVLKHPEYKQDSRVSDRINYDLMKSICEIEGGAQKVPNLMGNFKSRTTPLNVDVGS